MGEQKPRWWERALSLGRMYGGVNGAILFLKAIGWWTFIGPAIVAAAGIAGGIVESLPVTLIVTIAVSSFAAVMSLIMIFRIHRENRRYTELTQPTWKHWDRVDEFMVFQAAALWEGVAPMAEPETATHRVYAAQTMIKNAIFRKDITFLSDGAPGTERPALARSDIHLKTFVSRQQLRRLAEVMGDRPRFLYPP